MDIGVVVEEGEGQIPDGICERYSMPSGSKATS